MICTSWHFFDVSYLLTLHVYNILMSHYTYLTKIKMLSSLKTMPYQVYLKYITVVHVFVKE